MFTPTALCSSSKAVTRSRFKEGDLVFRRVMPNTRDPTSGTLEPSWERSYQVIKVVWYGVKPKAPALVEEGWNDDKESHVGNNREVTLLKYGSQWQ
ncbi:unnamed protein product [Citrullus colocynthis]|uniref:Uncharacterized protein n=1 Tax=Citrullus colocynthis TaxID=252529 RepID=A0ABP0Z0P7_9ROSI